MAARPRHREILRCLICNTALRQKQCVPFPVKDRDMKKMQESQRVWSPHDNDGDVATKASKVLRKRVIAIGNNIVFHHQSILAFHMTISLPTNMFGRLLSTRNFQYSFTKFSKHIMCLIASSLFLSYLNSSYISSNYIYYLV